MAMIQNEAPFLGGVVVRHRDLTFVTEADSAIPLNKLTLTYETPKGGDYDTGISISYSGIHYSLPLTPKLLCPLLAFIGRDGYAVFTVPEVVNPDYLQSHQLVRADGAYIAKEFQDPELTDFMARVDLRTYTEPLSKNLKAALLKSLSSHSRGFDLEEPTAPNYLFGSTSYLNADFNIDYKAYLTESNGAHFVDIAGLPLRYYWTKIDDRINVDNIRVFSFPKPHTLQYEAVLFYQTAAVFRAFYQHKIQDFKQVSRMACNEN
jgi:hypothetical protein